jgi:hypothetical protein
VDDVDYSSTERGPERGQERVGDPGKKSFELRNFRSGSGPGSSDPWKEEGQGGADEAPADQPLPSI